MRIPMPGSISSFARHLDLAFSMFPGTASIISEESTSALMAVARAAISSLPMRWYAARDASRSLTAACPSPCCLGRLSHSTASKAAETPEFCWLKKVISDVDVQNIVGLCAICAICWIEQRRFEHCTTVGGRERVG